MELSLHRIAAALILGLLCAHPSQALPGYGANVDAFCTLNARTPPAPYGGDCAICHNPASKDLDRTPGFTAYRDHKRDGDFSYFCPAPNLPPVLAPIGNQLVSEQGLLELLVTAIDPEGGSVFLEASGVPAGALFQDNADGSASFVWMPILGQAGNHPVLFKATDAGNPPASASEDIIISVGNGNRPPVLDPIGNQSVAAGERLVLVLSASDPDREPVAFSASGMPATAQLLDLGNGSAEFSWLTAVAEAGNVAVTFIVSDMATPPLRDEETIIITVGAVNRPPQLAPIGRQQVNPGATLSLQITALDPDGDGLQFALAGVPSGAGFSDAGNGSAVFRWAPRADQTGDYSLTCSVTDLGVPAESAAETFTISVGAVNAPPVLGPPARQPRFAPFRCGIGFELVFVIPPLMWLHDKRRRRSPPEGPMG